MTHLSQNSPRWSHAPSRGCRARPHGVTPGFRTGPRIGRVHTPACVSRWHASARWSHRCHAICLPRGHVPCGGDHGADALRRVAPQDLGLVVEMLAMTTSHPTLDPVVALGYTPREADFLRLVARYGGYFVMRQYCAWGRSEALPPPPSPRTLLRRKDATQHTPSVARSTFHLAPRGSMPPRAGADAVVDDGRVRPPRSRAPDGPGLRPRPPAVPVSRTDDEWGTYLEGAVSIGSGGPSSAITAIVRRCRACGTSSTPVRWRSRATRSARSDLVVAFLDDARRRR